MSGAVTSLTCPHCGRVGSTTKAVPPGAKFICPGCRQPFRSSASSAKAAPPAPSPRPFVDDDLDVAAVLAAAPPKTKAAPPASAGRSPVHLPSGGTLDDQPSDARIPCPYCGESILSHARKCRHCGEFLDNDLRAQRAVPTHQINVKQVSHAPVHAPAHAYHSAHHVSPGVAALLSLVIPGAGQMYKGEIAIGIFWLIAVPIGYLLFILPGLVLHLICIVTAASGGPSRWPPE